MKKVLIISFFLLTATVLRGQDSTYFTKSNVFLEFGGAGGLSANYERLFPINDLVKFSGRAGLGFYPTNLGLFGTKPRFSAVVPIMFNFIYGRTISLETGLGLSIGFDDAGSEDVNAGFVKWYNGTLGLRLQKPGKGLLLRLGYTPIATFSSVCQNSLCTETQREFGFHHRIGVSLGTRIKSKKKSAP